MQEEEKKDKAAHSTPFPEEENKKPAAGAKQGQAGAGSGAKFECNICLDIANEPVVSTCGHLYCWTCIF